MGGGSLLRIRILWPEELWRIRRLWSRLQPWILHPWILRTWILWSWLQPWLLRTWLRRLLPTTDTATPDLATLASGTTEDMVLASAVDTLALDTPDSATPVATDTAVATDTSDKKDPVLQSTNAFKTSPKQNDNS